MPVTWNDAVRRLLDEPLPAVLATVNADGSPQTSVVWITRDDDDILISTAEGRRKDRNIRRDPRVSLTVYDPGNPLQYVEIRGTATIASDPGRALAVRIAEEYEGPGAGEVYLALPPEVIRIAIRIAPHHMVGTATARPTA